MPIYDYLCPRCGEVSDIWAHINEERKVHEECGSTMTRLISPTRCNPDYAPWMDENLSGQDGKPVLVKSRRHHKQLLKERGLAIR
jgi:putative FmdB family regulatory protein